jgi:hypothetical protein
MRSNNYQASASLIALDALLEAGDEELHHISPNAWQENWQTLQKSGDQQRLEDPQNHTADYSLL